MRGVRYSSLVPSRDDGRLRDDQRWLRAAVGGAAALLRPKHAVLEKRADAGLQRVLVSSGTGDFLTLSRQTRAREVEGARE